MTTAGSGRRPGVRSLGVPRWAAALILAMGIMVSARASGDEQDGYPAPERPWRLAIVDVETGDELWATEVQAGDAVWYSYVHSADKTPVESLLRVVPPPEGLVLELERYLWYGAGLEFRRDRGVVLDGEWVVVHAERALGRLVLRVAGTVAQTVTVGGEAVVLADLASYGRRVALEVRP